MNMKALTGKELNYLVDCISNENLLMKQAAATAGSSTHHEVHQLLANFVQVHQHHIHTLNSTIEDHANMAPTSPQAKQLSQ